MDCNYREFEMVKTDREDLELYQLMARVKISKEEVGALIDSEYEQPLVKTELIPEERWQIEG